MGNSWFFLWSPDFIFYPADIHVPVCDFSEKIPKQVVQLAVYEGGVPDIPGFVGPRVRCTLFISVVADECTARYSQDLKFPEVSL